MLLAAGLGLEPRWLVPETRILPLDDPARIMRQTNADLAYHIFKYISANYFFFLFLLDARTNSVKIGCGLSGRALNSG